MFNYWTVVFVYLGEKGSTVLATRPTILFCDLSLAPGESQTCGLFGVITIIKDFLDFQN